MDFNEACGVWRCVAYLISKFKLATLGMVAYCGEQAGSGYVECVKFVCTCKHVIVGVTWFYSASSVYIWTSII